MGFLRRYHLVGMVVLIVVLYLTIRPNIPIAHAMSLGEVQALGEKQLTSPTLDASRDRLLSDYATQRGESADVTWAAMSDSERDVFLTITDLLGNRSPMENDPSRSHEQALDHVTSIVNIRGQNPYGTCGGQQWSRMFVVVSDRLLDYLRNPKRGLPTWRESRDGYFLFMKLFWWVGPHQPFNDSAETVTGRPRGQAHFWSNARWARGSRRIREDGYFHPNLVEFDEDYNLMHDSGPRCTYDSEVGPVDGITKHHLTWSQIGTGNDPGWKYQPRSSANRRTFVERKE